MLLSICLSIYLFIYVTTEGGRGRRRVGNCLWLFCLSKCAKKIWLHKEIKALKQPWAEFQEQKWLWCVCTPAPGVLQHVVFTELAAYSSSPVVRERFVSSEGRESLTSRQNYRYSWGTLIHVWVRAYINIPRLLKFVFPQDSLSSSTWNIYTSFPLNFEAIFTVPLCVHVF